mmetsp:Transcript_14947/g.47089  ORF Transcript_14947/g.47089 Transcript_14947/m.47089 type:complete len:234 (+) Transcript_14947:84-785(+)
MKSSAVLCGLCLCTEVSGLLQSIRRTEDIPLNEEGTFDCDNYSELCKPPFNCDRRKKAKAMMGMEGLAASGHSNLQAWCDAPAYVNYAVQCLQKNNPAYAGELLYRGAQKGDFGEHAFEKLASYCFMEGHCTDTQVKKTTTVEEAEKMCDERVGHARWTSWGSKFTPPQELFDPKADNNGYKNRNETTPLILSACAAGRFHCDVMACKENFCKDAHFMVKYGHLLQENGWPVY